MKETLSIRLFKTLKKGAERLSGEALQQMVRFVVSQCTEEASFKDKSGRADLYYTLFGWMLSHILNIRLNAAKAKSYLNRQDIHSLDLIHYAAYMRCRMILRLWEGGKTTFLFKSLLPVGIKGLHDFSSLPHNDPRSPYTLFVWLSLLEDTGNRTQIPGVKRRFRHPDKKEILRSLAYYRAGEGGYMNAADGLTAATNATVAALAVKGQLEGYHKNADIHVLRNMQQSSGGFKATEASPWPDLLSTATALFMLNCYGIKPAYAAQDFIEAHWLDSGGFSATLAEEKSDIEYTFYGLLALGAVNTV